MIDKLMSRRCLIEAAAGALLLSGCSSQDESSTKKVKKQDKIKKAEASNKAKHLRDKDELYEVYDDSGIVTMYLDGLARQQLREHRPQLGRDQHVLGV